MIEVFDSLIDDFFKSSEQKKLVEKQSNMEILIKASNCKYLSYSFDKDMKNYKSSNRLLPFFKNRLEGANSMCDYIIFCEKKCDKENVLYILIIELKNSEDRKTSTQLLAGHCLANYIMETLKRLDFLKKEYTKLHKRPIHIKKEPIYRFISIRGNSKGTKIDLRTKDIKYDEKLHIDYKGTTFPLEDFLK